MRPDAQVLHPSVGQERECRFVRGGGADDGATDLIERAVATLQEKLIAEFVIVTLVCALFLFHLLEFSGTKFNLDVEALNARWADPDMIDSWSQMVIKHTEDSVDICTAAPETGIYKMLEDGRVVYDRFDYHRRAVESENEAFFLRILGPGDYRYEGADIGILVTRGRSMTKSFQLNERAKKWIHGIKQSVAAKPLPMAEAGPALADPAFKIL